MWKFGREGKGGRAGGGEGGGVARDFGHFFTDRGSTNPN